MASILLNWKILFCPFVSKPAIGILDCFLFLDDNGTRNPCDRVLPAAEYKANLRHLEKNRQKTTMVLDFERTVIVAHEIGRLNHLHLDAMAPNMHPTAEYDHDPVFL